MFQNIPTWYPGCNHTIACHKEWKHALGTSAFKHSTSFEDINIILINALSQNMQGVSIQVLIGDCRVYSSFMRLGHCTWSMRRLEGTDALLHGRMRRRGWCLYGQGMLDKECSSGRIGVGALCLKDKMEYNHWDRE
jgi:hypothetical protein